MPPQTALGTILVVVLLAPPICGLLVIIKINCIRIRYVSDVLFYQVISFQFCHRETDALEFAFDIYTNDNLANKRKIISN